MSTETSPQQATDQPRALPGPPLLTVGIVFVVLFLAGLIGSTVVAGTTFPSPFDAPSRILGYFTQHQSATLLVGFFQFAAAVPLMLFTATVYARLRHFGVAVAGSVIALTGGLAASVFLMLSGILTWPLARPEVLGDPAVVRAVQDLSFLTGGPAHVVFFGLFMAGVSVVALFTRMLPRWVAILGVVLAVIAEFSTLSLVVPALAILLPLARFPGFVWLIAVGALLPRQFTVRRGR
ncbi:DUF4386 family protein [Fodinicola feengrottensis]|uniref:DUF4386 family protein n=1 Tax=Fodinicola feengrottensis TaxID=435914 RepID=A0ABP4THG9_9ACTN|nr:DUF4386 family protein [Fodinicola feengrottensis]